MKNSIEIRALKSVPGLFLLFAMYTMTIAFFLQIMSLQNQTTRAVHSRNIQK